MKPLFTVILIAASFALSACGDITNIDLTSSGGRHGLFTPEAYMMGDLPDGDDGYSTGFRHGCNTSQGIMGSGLLRSHAYAYDVNRGIVDKDYYAGYRQGFRYCMIFIDPSPL